MAQPNLWPDGKGGFFDDRERERLEVIARNLEDHGDSDRSREIKSQLYPDNPSFHPRGCDCKFCAG